MATKKVAQALGALNNNVVYVGGAMVSLYIDDTSAEDVRPTKDIDITMEIASLGELEKIREELIQKGFYQTNEDNVICRFRYEDIKVDVMATKPVGWAPANPWFEPGFKYIVRSTIDEIEIKYLSLPFFLATKFTAFYDRGAKDPRTSHDFEDIVYLLNYTTNLVEQILTAPNDVKVYLMSCFSDVLSDSVKQEAILGNLFYEDQEHRHQKIVEKLKKICQSKI
jgi:predicted nucleotidyltransferase